MDIKFEIEPVFKIEFFKIKCVDFKNKKAKIEEVLGHYPEMPFANFYSNTNKARINKELLEIFKGIMPFLGIVIFGMFLMYMFPGIALWLPDVLFAD